MIGRQLPFVKVTRRGTPRFSPSTLDIRQSTSLQSSVKQPHRSTFQSVIARPHIAKTCHGNAVPSSRRCALRRGRVFDVETNAVAAGRSKGGPSSSFPTAAPAHQVAIDVFRLATSAAQRKRQKEASEVEKTYVLAPSAVHHKQRTTNSEQRQRQ